MKTHYKFDLELQQQNLNCRVFDEFLQDHLQQSKSWDEILLHIQHLHQMSVNFDFQFYLLILHFYNSDQKHNKF